MTATVEYEGGDLEQGPEPCRQQLNGARLESGALEGHNKAFVRPSEEIIWVRMLFPNPVCRENEDRSA